jgi:hypothetical protein
MAGTGLFRDSTWEFLHKEFRRECRILFVVISQFAHSGIKIFKIPHT